MNSSAYKHVVVATRVGSSWFNSDESRFAIVPDGNGAIDREIADFIETMIDQAAGGDLSLREEAVRELLDLQARQLVFLPVGFLWGRSGLGRLHEQWFVSVLADVDPDLVDQREAIESSGPIEAVKSLTRRKNLSFVLWKILATFVYASSHVDTLDDIEPLHISALASMVRPDGEWSPWTTIWTQRSIRFCVQVLADARNDPHFGRDIDDKGYQTRGSRKFDEFRRWPHLSWFDTSYNRWVDELALAQTKSHFRAKRLIAETLGRLPVEDTESIDKAFSHSNVLHILDAALVWSTPALRIGAVGHLHEYGRWIQDESRDADGNPTVPFALSKSDVERFRKKVLPLVTGGTGSEVAARPMPLQYHRELVKIITEDDFAWPKSLVSQKTGRPLHWITWTDPETGTPVPVFCEVLPRLLLLMLDLPLRGIQARRLDSGEGDSRRWDEKTGRWEDSSTRHAGYWKAVGARNVQRGVFKEIPTLGSNGSTHITGFWINSNKTQDRESLFDEKSGYQIPWELDDVLQNLAAMRAWQEKYNAVEGPLPYAEIPKGIFQGEPTQIVRENIPSRFYLFRYPPNGGGRGREAPPTYKILLQFFYDALEELERRLNAEGATKPIVIITARDRAGAPRKAIFTMHGMRSSTLTSLYNEGVPIAILSKIVAGHATILMTLKYAKFEPAHVSQILTKARVDALSNAALQFSNFLQNASFEQAAKMTARLKDDGLRQLNGQFSEPSTWGRMDIGICPNGGTLCHIGGVLKTKRTHNGIDKSVYKPVPGGSRNCVRCRFVISGVPYLVPLWGHGNKIAAHIDNLHTRISERERELEKLKLQRREASLRKEPSSPDIRRRISVLEAEWNADVESRDQAYADLHTTIVLVEQIRAIRHDTSVGDTQIPMIIREEGLPAVEGRESTRFELTDAVVQMSRFYPSLSSADLERERDSFLDRVLYREGYIPISLAPLSIEDRRASADALSALILSELGSKEAQNLIDGRKTLNDFGLQDRLEETCRKSIGKALKRLPLGSSRGDASDVLELEPQ